MKTDAALQSPGVGQRLSAALTAYPAAQLSAYATVVVAFFLRVYRLADQNIWWDEGWSLWLSQKDPAWIALRTAADEHPPLHYWLLHFWDMLAGTQAVAGRFLSVAFGVLTIALVYRLGKRIGGAWVGLAAACLLATARFHIWWSQDIKNYTPSIFFAFAALWFALDLLQPAGEKPTRRSLLGYGFCAALALWTHYLAALVLLAANAYALLVLARALRISRRAGLAILQDWIGAQVLAGALFAPWLALYLQNAVDWTAAPAFDFLLFLRLVATVLPLGITTDIDNYALLTAVFTALAVLGAGSILFRRRMVARRGPQASRDEPTVNPGLGLVLVVLLPPLLIYLLSLTPVSFFAPKIQARYLLILLPAYAVLLALGLAALRRVSIYLALGAVLVIVAANALVLNDYYAGRRLRDDYSTLANTINAFARPDDLVLLDTDQEWPTFLYYLRAPLEWLGAPNGAAMNAANADLLARRALARHGAVWLVAIPDALATDPQRLLETRLARDLPRQLEQTFGDKRLVLYAPASRDWAHVPPENFAPQVARLQSVDNGLELLGFDLPVREALGGDLLHLVTYWSWGVGGRVRINGQPVEVPAGERVRVQSDIAVPPDAQGDLTLGVNGVELARVRVERAATEDAIRPVTVGDSMVPREALFGGSIRLTGYEQPTTSFQAGQSVPITLYWRAEQPVLKSYTVFVHLVGEQFNPVQNNPLWGQVDRLPRNGAAPTTAWIPGQIIADPYRVPIDRNAPPGTYTIEVGLYDPATGERLPVEGGGDSAVISKITIK